MVREGGLFMLALQRKTEGRAPKGRKCLEMITIGFEEDKKVADIIKDGRARKS